MATDNIHSRGHFFRFPAEAQIFILNVCFLPVAYSSVKDTQMKSSMKYIQKQWV